MDKDNKSGLEMNIASFDDLERAPINSKLVFSDGRVETKLGSFQNFFDIIGNSNAVYTKSIVKEHGEEYISFTSYSSNSHNPLNPSIYLKYSKDIDSSSLFSLVHEYKRFFGDIKK